MRGTGRTIAVGSRDSAQAAILPLHYLKEEGLVPEADFTLMRFDRDLGKHGDSGSSEQLVVEAVLSGRADAGALGESFWGWIQSREDSDSGKLKSIWTSPSYSHCNLTVRPSLDPDLRRRLREAFLNMDYEDHQVRSFMELEGVKRWIPGVEEGYRSLEAAVEADSQSFETSEQEKP